ncbi:MAG: glycosyltransferase family 4 protein, partial [Bacteroidetes bacterium]|nr:glycosyltransferase family 4 protein [Bacteroidota bacterium]
MASAHILVLNWHFPPHEGIGGRRTALLVEHWISKGIEVTVIAKKPHPYGKKSDWIDGSVLNQIHLVHIDHENPYNALFFKSDSR